MSWRDDIAQGLEAPSSVAALPADAIHVEYLAAVAGFDATDAGMWIRSATHRVNIVLLSSQPRELLALLEAFLHLRLRPRYER